jgi:hypothetical protein
LDAYLDIAEKVLRLERRPLSSRAMIGAAYRRDLVPPHLHGQTQHKTLGARISEDILALRERSLFFRAAPGRYFLRSFLTDTSIPEEHRQPVATRRRVRDLIRGPALAVDSRELEKVASADAAISPEVVLGLLRQINTSTTIQRIVSQQACFYGRLYP